MKRVIAVIPARYASTRLPAKILADIHGKPMIQWVFERVKKAQGIDEVFIATDDERIAGVVRGFGGQVVMTGVEIQSGTDRVAAVADQVAGDIFVNIQGDEPLLEPEAIEGALELVRSGRFSMATVMTPLRSEEELRDPSVVKVIVDRSQRAIYFSRYPIPYSRGELPPENKKFISQRHVGLYVYDRNTLMRFRGLAASPLEKAEVLEQLRALADGIAIGVSAVHFLTIGVDTHQDLERVRQVLKS